MTRNTRVSKSPARNYIGHAFWVLKTGLSVVTLFVIGSNIWVFVEGNGFIVEQMPYEKKEYAIVLGASVKGTLLSGALQGRMNKAIELFKAGIIKKILISGDGGVDPYYDETTAMRLYAMRFGVPESELVVDPQGYSTYGSIVRAKRVFSIQSAYIISQHFHLRRALWLANALDINALGVPTGNMDDELFYELREVPARTKDLLLFLSNAAPQGVTE